ncbi:inosine-5'-monophosphate dehydrogenase [bacterium BMS3Bbin10]|nr:inosine-5'-monophosphate dehydrogenase [bacterium BMS3Bbin10]
MTVGKILEKLGQQIATCRPEDTIQTVATILTTKGVGALPVCDERGEMVGIISERDIVTAFSLRGGEIKSLRVRDVMTSDVISCTGDDTPARARALLQTHRFRHLPVMNDGKLAGILSIRDLLEIRLEETELEVNVLKDSVIAARFR